MELHQLRYFLAVADAGSFTAAAEAVRISQSGVSTQLQKLEAELGVQLIDRSSRRVSLTAAGLRLAPHARAALAAVDGVSVAADDIRGLVTGTLQVGTVTGLAWPPLFDALAALHAAHPGLEIRLAEGNSDDLIGQVRDGTADVAIAAWSGRPPECVNVSVAFDEPLVAAVSPTHPWATRNRLRVAELARSDLIALPRGTGSRTALDAMMGRAGLHAQPRWEVATPAFIGMLAARGLGVGMGSETTARHWKDTVLLRIADRAARSQLGVIWGDRPSHAAAALLALLSAREEASQPPTSP